MVTKLGIYQPDLSISDPAIAKIPACDNKCNVFVSEVVYDILGKSFADPNNPAPDQPGKYFPYRVQQIADPNQNIPHFPVVKDNPQPGDIWSKYDEPTWITWVPAIGPVIKHLFTTHHTGIYLDKYNGIDLYISARTDTSGVFGLGLFQHGAGIQIKALPSGGIFRHYTP